MWRTQHALKLGPVTPIVLNNADDTDNGSSCLPSSPSLIDCMPGRSRFSA